MCIRDRGNTVAVISDGSAVLGLGNIGPYAAMPVMEGKSCLFKEFGGVNSVPICLDTQDTEEIIRVVKAIAPGFGGINLEDISAPRCFEIEERLKAELDIPVFHDDQHGTAIVVLAAAINALKVTGRKKEDCKIVVNGAGSAGIAITKLLLSYGFPYVIMCDKSGILHKGCLLYTSVQSRKAHADGPGHQRQPDAPQAVHIQRQCQRHRQQKIFRHMAAFADEMVKMVGVILDLRLGQVEIGHLIHRFHDFYTDFIRKSRRRLPVLRREAVYHYHHAKRRHKGQGLEHGS